MLRKREENRPTADISDKSCSVLDIAVNADMKSTETSQWGKQQPALFISYHNPNSQKQVECFIFIEIK